MKYAGLLLIVLVCGGMGMMKSMAVYRPGAVSGSHPLLSANPGQ